jgi:hypothetical protein
VAMSAANVVCVRHMWRARRLQWSKRRTRLVVVHYAMLNLQVHSNDISMCMMLDARCTSSRRKLRVICELLILTLICAYELQCAISLVQMVNAAAWLAPNVRVLQTQCAWCGMPPDYIPCALVSNAHPAVSAVDVMVG